MDASTQTPAGGRSATPESRPKRKPPRSAWQKGQSGNPGGKPKGPSALAALFKRIEELNAMQPIVDAFINQLKNGNTQAFAIFLDRCDGKVREELNLSGAVKVGIARGLPWKP